MEKILELAKKQAEAAEVFTVTHEETPLRFEANRLKQAESKQSTYVSLRLVRQGKIGLATATSLDDRERLVRNAVETAGFGMAARFEFPLPASYPQIDVYDPAVASTPIAKMAEMGQQMIDAIRRNTPDITCEAGVSQSTVTVRLMNSRGGQASYRKTIFGLGVEGTVIHNTDMLFVGDGESSCHPILDTSYIINATIRQLDLAKNIVSVPSRPMPVIFTPEGVAGALSLPLTSGFNGKTVLEGASPIGNRLGLLVFDDDFSLWDDPTIAFRPESRPCDDEGIPSQRTPLVEHGVVMNFLYDLQTAALANAKSTGNAERGRGGMPTPGPSSFVIATGKTSFDEMVQDIKEGLIVEQLIGAGQGNYLSGDFSGNVLLGYKIEDGKIAGRVKNTMISGNIYELMQHIAAIGSEAKWVGSFLYTPPLCFHSVSVASKG